MRITPTLAVLLGSLCSLPLLVACASAHDRPQPRANGWERVVDGTWRLVALEGAPPIAGVDVTLAFDDQGRIHGHTGANRWFAGVEHTGGDGFVTGAAGSTKMFRAEPPGLMEQEGRFLAALARVQSFRLVDERLELVADGRVLLAFEPG